MSAQNSTLAAVPDRPVAPVPNFEACHTELLPLMRVLWQYEWKKPSRNSDKGRWTKVPKQPDGSNASSTNPATWSTAVQVQQAYAKGGGFDGGGLVTAADDPYIFFDLDHVIDVQGSVIAWAATILEAARAEGAYIERSPSGDGFHIIGRGEPLAKGVGKKRNDAEAYSEGRYFTFTGNVVFKPDGSLGELVETRRLMLARIAEVPAADDVLLDKARKANKFCTLFDAGDIGGYPSASEADAALAMLLCHHTRDATQIKRLMNRSALKREKWSTHATYLDDTIQHVLKESKAPAELPADAALEDFYYYSPMGRFIYAPTRDLWPAVSVNALLTRVEGKKASTWISRHHPVLQMTWAPGEEQIIRDRLVDNGWVVKKGANVFNQYRPPRCAQGNANDVDKWLVHLERVFPPPQSEHIILWLAHRVQFPGIKINHALVFVGGQGIGKDTALEPVQYAVGEGNFADIRPKDVTHRFNPWVRSVILRINEAHDLGDVNRYAFYEATKTLTVSPPRTILCEPKNVDAFPVFNLTGPIYTTNHLTDGIYLPPDDRRHHVSYSELQKEDFPKDYWNDIYTWFAKGGSANVAAYLRALDLSGFDPKAPPPLTDAFHAIVDANRSSMDGEMADAIDALGKPHALTISDLLSVASDGLCMWLSDTKNRRAMPHRLSEVDYVSVPSKADSHLWIVSGKRQVIYAQRSLSLAERLNWAETLTKRPVPVRRSFDPSRGDM